MKESDLFEPIKTFLLENGCSQVYGEVLSFDVLGINGPANIIVELKTSLNFKLIDQAMDRLKYGDYVYIAIPYKKSPLPFWVKKFLKDHKIGLIEVMQKYGETMACVTIPARYNRIARMNRGKGFDLVREKIRPYHETQIGGVKGGEAVTDYSVMIDGIKEYLKTRGRGKWVTVEDILRNCEIYYAKPKPSIISTLQAHWNSGWCETKVENKIRYFKYKKVERVLV